MKSNVYRLKKYCHLALILTVVLSLSACIGSEDSVDIPTNEIYMDVSLVQKVGSTNTKIKVLINQKYFYGDRIKLTDGEKIIVSYGDIPVTLQKNDSLLGIGYEGVINNSADGEFVFIFQRRDGTEIKTEINMPSSFDVTSPSRNDTYYEGDTLFVNWSPSLEGENMNIHGHIACQTIEDDLELDIDNENETWTTNDSGSFHFPLWELASNIRLEVFLENDTLLSGTRCDFDIEVYRKNKISLNQDYAGGSTIYAQKIISIENMDFYVK